MSITFGDARKFLAEYAGRGGKCAASEEVRLFVMQVLQHLLYSGATPNIRKFCFNAVNGHFTIPNELETILKVKIDGKSAQVWDKFYEFYNTSDLDGCVSAFNAVHEEPNHYPTVYDIPAGGARVGVYATADEDPSKTYVLVKGKDPSGREVFTNHCGTQISGEILYLQKGIVKYSEVTFGRITSIEKTDTVGYVTLLWVKPDLGTRGFLADYTPLENKPSYRRFKLTTECNTSGSVLVSVLGKIRLKERYSDTDVLPFDNLNTLLLAAQTVNSFRNKDVQVAQLSDAAMQEFISREAMHKKVTVSQPIEINFVTSGGAIRTLRRHG